MRSLEVLTLQERDRWNWALKQIDSDQTDIYFKPEYHEVFQFNGDGKALCFLFSDGIDVWVKCGMLNSIRTLGYDLDKEYFDLQSVYGYSGTISSTTRASFLDAAKSRFNEYCLENNIIAAFSRLNPIIGNHRLALNPLFDRETVIVELEAGYDEIWKNQYSTNTRNMVRKALKLGYSIKFISNPSTDEINTFINLYLGNMNQVGAYSYYHFSRDFFFKFFSDLKDSIRLLAIEDNMQKTLCSAIVLKHNRYLHYHLSGRLINTDNCINTFLLDRAIWMGCEEKDSVFHLGGGRTNALDDSLLRFKGSFSSIRRKYYIEKEIFIEEVLSRIHSQWIDKFPQKAQSYSKQLLGYRNV